jgi:hypothetical protein
VGTDKTDGLELVNITTVPPGAAGPVSLTLLLLGAVPPTTEDEDRLMEAGVFGFRFRFTWRVTAEIVPEMVTLVGETTWNVAIGNVACVAPPGTATLADTLAKAGSDVTKSTVMPEEGAGPVSLAVPVSWTPPTAFPEDSVTESKFTGLRVRFADRFTPL